MNITPSTTVDWFMPLPHEVFCERCKQLIERIGAPTPEQRQIKGGTCQRCLDHMELCGLLKRLIETLRRIDR